MGKFDRNPGCRRCSLARRRDPVHPQPANGAKISPQKQVFDRPQPLSCGHVAPVCRESLPYAGYGRSGARPIRGSRSPESLSEFLFRCSPIPKQYGPCPPPCPLGLVGSGLRSCIETARRPCMLRDGCGAAWLNSSQSRNPYLEHGRQYANLHHAYSPASDIPRLLRQLDPLPIADGKAEP